MELEKNQYAQIQFSPSNSGLYAVTAWGADGKKATYFRDEVLEKEYSGTTMVVKFTPQKTGNYRFYNPKTNGGRVSFSLYRAGYSKFMQYEV